MVRKDLKLNTIVYCNTTYNTALKGKIISGIKFNNDGTFYYNVSGIDIRGIFGCRIYDMFLTEEQALDDYNYRSKFQLRKYKSNINSLEDLLKFAISKMYVEEYTDYDAIQAIKERSKELLNIEIS